MHSLKLLMYHGWVFLNSAVTILFANLPTKAANTLYKYQQQNRYSMTMLTRPVIFDSSVLLILMHCPFNICCHQ
jgi:hypothetical protein